MKLTIVTATTDLERSRKCLASWGDTPSVVVYNNVTDVVGFKAEDYPSVTYLCSPQYLGTVPAFKAGVDHALDHTDADIICCLHDDLEIEDPLWAQKVIRHFETHADCGLAGFGGAIGLGDDNLYQVPYRPVQLARRGFRSNLVDAEVHGLRSLLPERVACLDGFSQIGRREFFKGLKAHYPGNIITGADAMQGYRPWTYLEEHGIIHHFYDGALGALAARYGWSAWYLPIRCCHYGGQTAVGDQGYQQWAADQILGGDLGFWQQSHQRGYDLFHDVLPLRV